MDTRLLRIGIDAVDGHRDHGLMPLGTGHLYSLDRRRLRDNGRNLNRARRGHRRLGRNEGA
jgi:hypothetical protein